MRILLASILLLASHKPERQIQQPDADWEFIPVCASQILVHNENWHCITNDVNHPEVLACDYYSMHILLLRFPEPGDCFKLHMAVPHPRKENRATPSL